MPAQIFKLDGLRRILVASLLVLSLFAQSRSARPIPAVHETFDKENKVAVLIGVADYPENTGLTKLKYTGNDVKELAQALRESGYTVRELLGVDALTEGVRNELNAQAKAFTPGKGTFLVYFAGHGFSHKKANYLATLGASVNHPSSALKVSDVLAIMKRSQARHLMFWIDACRNNPEARAARSVTEPRSFEALEQAEGLRVLYATKPGMVSNEDPDLQHGVFTYFLLKGLRGEAAGSDGLITFDDLFNYITPKIADYASTNGRPQSPVTTGLDVSGDFLVSHGTSHTPEHQTETVSPASPQKRAGLPAATQTPVPARSTPEPQPIKSTPPALSQTTSPQRAGSRWIEFDLAGRTLDFFQIGKTRWQLRASGKVEEDNVQEVSRDDKSITLLGSTGGNYTFDLKAKSVSFIAKGKSAETAIQGHIVDASDRHTAALLIGVTYAKTADGKLSYLERQPDGTWAEYAVSPQTAPQFKDRTHLPDPRFHSSLPAQKWTRVQVDGWNLTLGDPTAEFSLRIAMGRFNVLTMPVGQTQWQPLGKVLTTWIPVPIQIP